MATFSQERTQRGGNWDQQRKNVVHMNDRYGLNVVGSVFLRTVMAQSDFVLIIESVLVVLGVGGIENPLSEAFAHASDIFR